MTNAQKRIKDILNNKKIGLQEREVRLRELAQEYGCSLDSSYLPDGKHLTEEVIRRIQEAERSTRESNLWWIAVLAAIASIFSALAAWFAVLKK